jgi:hypothetical protein
VQSHWGKGGRRRTVAADQYPPSDPAFPYPSWWPRDVPSKHTAIVRADAVAVQSTAATQTAAPRVSATTQTADADIAVGHARRVAAA